MSRSFVLVLCVLASACGGTIVDLDGGALDSGGQDSAKKDSGGNDATPVSFECAKVLCSGDEVCVHPCCGGAQICAALEDGGMCPSGLTLSQQCPPEMPCTNVCVPPEPYCEPASQCPMSQGHDCYLLCE